MYKFLSAAAYMGAGFLLSSICVLVVNPALPEHPMVYIMRFGLMSVGFVFCGRGFGKK